MDEYTFDGQFYESKSRVGGIAGKKANWFGFLEINEWTWNHRSILWSTRLRQESYILPTQCCSDWISKISLAVKAHFVKCSPAPVTWDKVNWKPWSESWFEDDDLKIHSTEKGVLVADTEVEWIIPPGNSKSGVWHRSKGKARRNSTLERKRAVPNEGPWGKLPGVQVSSPEGLCPPKASFFLFSLSLQWTERWEAGLGLKVEFKVTSQSNCTSEGRKSRLRATRRNVSKVTESS